MSRLFCQYDSALYFYGEQGQGASQSVSSYFGCSFGWKCILNATQFYVWGKEVYLPFDGVVVTADSGFPDHAPNTTAAVEMEDHEDGSSVDLEEQPHNGVEISPGGPFLLRLLHFKQNSVPADVRGGNFYAAGALVGAVGNSGTTLVPHLHVALGFSDQNGRFWSLPIEWEDYRYRNLLPYSTGYEFGP